MSRTKNGAKKDGYEYSSKRPMCYNSASSWAKTVTHRMERKQDKQQIHRELKSTEESSK